MEATGAARRDFLMQAGVAGAAALALCAGEVKAQTLPPLTPFKPKHKVRFSVCGISHDHIHGMMAAVTRGGGEIVNAWGAEPDKLETFRRRYPNVRMVATPDEIINDDSQLMLTSQVPSERAQLGVGAMKAGKDVLADKPGAITLKDLALIRRTIRETGRKYAIQYSERLDVRAAVHAGELIRQGAIGKVIQTVNLAPHQIYQGGGDAGGAGGRPDWFWDDRRFGGILADIGSHQVDQFLYYTGSKTAEVVASQIANIGHPDRPRFQDFGDMTLRGDAGLGYVRLDWYTPKGLGVWGDGRLFVLGTEGYIELRKYVDVAVGPRRDNLFIVDQKSARYIDCSNGDLPFGPQLIDDIVDRTETAQNQDMALLAAELAIKAQLAAKTVVLTK